MLQKTLLGLLCLSLTTIAQPLWAQPFQTDGADPQAVVTDWSASDPWEITGGELERVRYQVIDDADLGPAGNGRLIRMEIPGQMRQAWSVQIQAPTQTDLRQGDRMLGRVWLRCAKSMTGQAYAMFGLERSGPPHDKSVYVELTANTDWQQFDIAFEAHEDFAAGEATAVLHLGFDTQTIEVGGIELYNYRNSVELETLPTVDLSYPGREAGAEWREQALARIDQTRKGDLHVVVLDSAGRPVPDAQVTINMHRHAFPFGTAVALPGLIGDSPDDVKYREVLTKYFNHVVFENAMKWRNHGIGTPEEIDRALDWLEQQNLPVRGHVLVWPGWNVLPEWLPDLADDPDALRAAVAERITSTVARYQGRITDWDVMNEAVTNYDLMDILGYEVMAEWFKLAELVSPQTPRYINDYGILTGGRQETGHQRAYYAIIQRLLEEGAPLSGIGVQGHVASSPTPPARVLQILDQFAAFGLPIKVTELDLSIQDRSLQADYMRDFLIATFSHPSVDGILVWGFWAGRHWRPEAGHFDHDWNILPHGQAWIDLVHGDWMTREHATTDHHGHASFRGFYGDYDVVVEADGKRLELSFPLRNDGESLEIVME
ncbi:MAG: endo-1,4-beta-xylanase [Phycisphaeraceae bacterium]